MNHGYVNRNPPTGDFPQVPDRRLRPHQADLDNVAPGFYTCLLGCASANQGVENKPDSQSYLTSTMRE